MSAEGSTHDGVRSCTFTTGTRARSARAKREIATASWTPLPASRALAISVLQSCRRTDSWSGRMQQGHGCSRLRKAAANQKIMCSCCCGAVVLSSARGAGAGAVNITITSRAASAHALHRCPSQRCPLQLAREMASHWGTGWPGNGWEAHRAHLPPTCHAPRPTAIARPAAALALAALASRGSARPHRLLRLAPTCWPPCAVRRTVSAAAPRNGASCRARA